MKCPNCGAENPGGNATCFSCGTSLVGAGNQQVPPAQTQATPQPTYAAQQPGQQPVQQPTQQAQQTYVKGCVGSAWDDIKNSDGWIGRTLLLGLINIIPILNWILPGYCMRWARQLPMGRIESMPKQIFVNRGFVNGAYWFVLTLVFGLVSGIACGILGLVPILGWLAAIVLSVFMAMFLNVAIMRTALADRLGAGFDVSIMWAAFKRNTGSLLCITIVPGIIIGIVVSIIASIILVIAGLMVGGDIYNLALLANSYEPYSYNYGYGPGSYTFDYLDYSYAGNIPLASVMSIVGVLLPAGLIVYIIGCFAMAFQTLLVFRAMGHWTARYASDWTNDPTITASMNMYPDPAPMQTPPQA